MSFEEQINEGIRYAMKVQDIVRLEALRKYKSAQVSVLNKILHNNLTFKILYS